MEEKNNSHGGARVGAGRKKTNRTLNISLRATQEEKIKYMDILSKIKEKTGKEYIEIVLEALEKFNK